MGNFFTTVLQEIQIKRYCSLKVRLYRELIEDYKVVGNCDKKFNFKNIFMANVTKCKKGLCLHAEC
jgi:hypothetical protein